MTKFLDIYPCGNCGLQLHLDHILCGYWEISPALSGYAPSTPHYNWLFHPSLVPLLVASEPTIEYYWKVHFYFERKDVTSFLGHEHFISLFSYVEKIHLSTYMLLFQLIYVWCSCDYKKIVKYILKVQVIQSILFIYFSHHQLNTFIFLVGYHRGPKKPPPFHTLAKSPSYSRTSS